MSETFIRKVAEVGNGKSLLLSDRESFKEPLLNLLKESLSPALSNFQIHFDKKVIKGVAPLLNAQSHILRNEPVRLYLLVDKHLAEDSTQVKISFFDSVKSQRVEKVFTIRLMAIIQSDVYHRLFLKQVFDDKPIYLPLLQEENANPDSLKTGLSVSFQLWAPKYTSFICVARSSQEQEAEQQGNRKKVRRDEPDYSVTGQKSSYQQTQDRYGSANSHSQSYQSSSGAKRSPDTQHWTVPNMPSIDSVISSVFQFIDFARLGAFLNCVALLVMILCLT